MSAGIEIMCELPSIANLREHWAVRARRTRDHRALGYTLARHLLGRMRLTARAALAAGVTVTLTRCAPRALDGDNLQGAFKALRDGIADALGTHDRDPRITWRYAQVRARTPAVSVLISIRRDTVGC